MREILVYDDYEIHKLGAGGGTQYEEVTTEKATRIDVTDVAKTKGKLLPFGRTTQNGEPTPENPIPIENVEGRSCRNLFDEEWTGKISTNFIHVYAGRNYKYSEQGTGSAMNFRFYENTESSEYITTNVPNSEYYTPETDGYIKLYKPNTTFLDCQLEEGTVVTPYEPYFEGKRLEFNVCNKNIFDKEYFLQHKNDFINAYKGYFYAIELGDEYKKQITASISLKSQSQGLSGVALAFTSSYGTSPGGATRILTIDGTMKDVTYDFSNAEHVYLQVGAQTQGIAVDKLEEIFTNYNIQVNEGSTALPYEEHKEQTIPFPLVNGQKLMEGDYLADDGIHHVRNQVTLDGTEEGWGTDSQNLLADIRLPGGKKHSSTVTVGNGKSNRFTISNLANARANSNMFALYGTSELIAWFNRNGMTISQFKSWLGNNNVIVEYELAEEVIESYTSAQSEAYNKLKNLLLYKGVNHIWTNTDGLEPNLQLTYKRKKQEGVLQVSNIQPLNNLELNNTEETPEEVTTEISEE